jgi:Fe-S-cluster containining protein
MLLMMPSFEKIRHEYQKSPYFKEKLGMLYTAMDSKYDAAAQFYQFQCVGCEDNCCFTRFYHHTFLEYLYILDGFDTLEQEKRAEIKKRADAACKKLDEADKEGVPPRVLCPLNDDSRCILYPYRPMICRLHGVPHELNTSGHGANRNPGCDYFMKQNKDKSYFSFDRTTVYMEMANLEKEFRQKSGAMDKVKLTIAEMIRTRPF